MGFITGRRYGAKMGPKPNLLSVQLSQVVHGGSNIRMFFSEHLLENCNCFFIKGRCFVVFPLKIEKKAP